jgi:hypothetical protein
MITIPSKIQRIIRKYFENIFSRKLKNVEEMDKFLDGFTNKN